MINREIAIIVTIAAIMIMIPVVFGLVLADQGSTCGSSISSIEQQLKLSREKVQSARTADGALVVSGNNIYAAWNCFSHVLFTKSSDAGKTFANTTLINTHDTSPKTVVGNVTISAAGNTVAIKWDSNKTGIENPEIRASNDGGNTFSNTVTLNSIPGGINKPIGANTTSTSNMTGGTHDSSVHTTNPAARSTYDSGSSIRNVK